MQTPQEGHGESTVELRDWDTKKTANDWVSLSRNALLREQPWGGKSSLDATVEIQISVCGNKGCRWQKRVQYTAGCSLQCAHDRKCCICPRCGRWKLGCRRMTTMWTKKPKIKTASLDGNAHNPTTNNRRIACSFLGSRHHPQPSCACTSTQRKPWRMETKQKSN